MHGLSTNEEPHRAPSPCEGSVGICHLDKGLPTTLKPDLRPFRTVRMAVCVWKPPAVSARHSRGG